MKLSLAAFLVVLFASPALAADRTLHTFRKVQLSDEFWSEGATVGDLNRDGHPDVVAGPYWWEGPEFKIRHEYYPPTTTFELKLGPLTKVRLPGFHGALGRDNAYSDNFFAYTHDFNQDGWTDILILGFPGAKSTWFENPQGRPGHWKRHDILDVTDNESPTFTDLTGDGRPEIVCSSNGSYGYAEPDWSNPSAPWKWRPISPNNRYGRFTHGLGVGDVNGDGRMDLLEKDGWWEQPASLAGDPVWKHHPYPFAPRHGCAQMYAYDVNGDGRNDVITSLAAHGYGLAWYEQVPASDGGITFKKHIILHEQTSDARPAPNKYGVIFSQLHAVDLVDIDGDGLKDIVTGKRFWAHGPAGDAEPNAAAVLYWFKLVRGPDRSVDFLPYLIDHDSGIGTQVVALDANKDGRPDVVVGNKKGVFVMLQETKTVSEEEWAKHQPKAITP